MPLDYQGWASYPYMRLICLILSLMGIGFLNGCASDREAAKLFGNMTYYVGNEYGADAAKLVDGEHEERFLNVYYDNRYVYDDFNHDGLKDAAVITIENTGGNSGWHMLNFLINDGKELVHRSSEELDESARVNSMRQKNSKVIVDMYVHQEGDCRNWPTKRVRNVYQYSGPEFPVNS